MEVRKCACDRRTRPRYARLRRAGALADSSVARLNELGVGRNDRVAIVLPNSAEMAAAFVAIGCGATTAPLNPAYRQEEFDFYLDDLNARALVVEQGSKSPAIAAAERYSCRNPGRRRERSCRSIPPGGQKCGCCAERRYGESR